MLLFGPVALVGIMECIETGGRESRLHNAVKHMKREALKFTVVLCVSVRKLEQGPSSHTRRKPARWRELGKPKPGVSGTRPTVGQQQALSALRNRAIKQLTLQARLKINHRRDRRHHPVRSVYEIR